MKKKLAVLLAALMSLSVLFSFGACTKNKTSSEQFQDAAVSVAQYFSDYLKAGSLFPDFSEKGGLDATVSAKLDQLESDGISLLEDEFALTAHILADGAGNFSAEEKLTLGGETITMAGYLKNAAELILGFPEASDKYLSLTGAEGSEGTNVWKAVLEAVKAQINDTSVTVESVDREVDGSTQKGVAKLTFSADEAQLKAIEDAVAAELKETDDEDDTHLSELTVTFYVYRGSTAAVEFVLAADGDSSGKLTGELSLKNQDGKQFAANGKVSFTAEDFSLALTIDANQTAAESGRNGTVTIGMQSSDMEDADITLKIDYKEEIEDKTVRETDTISVSVKNGGASFSLEIPFNGEYTVDGDKVSGTFSASAAVDTFKLAVSGTLEMTASESVKVTVPEIAAENLISLDDIENESEAFLALQDELQEKYPELFGGISDPVDPDVVYPAFYLVNNETGEELDFYTDNTGEVLSYVLFEQTDGQAVITLDDNGSQVGFAFRPFGTDGYTLEQTVQLEDLTFEALVTEDEITLTNEEIGWSFWFMPEESYGVFQRSFSYSRTDDTIQLQVQPDGIVQELKKVAEDTYSLDGMEYQYTDAADYAD